MFGTPEGALELFEEAVVASGDEDELNGVGKVGEVFRQGDDLQGNAECTAEHEERGNVGRQPQLCPDRQGIVTLAKPLPNGNPRHANFSRGTPSRTSSSRTLGAATKYMSVARWSHWRWGRSP